MTKMNRQWISIAVVLIFGFTLFYVGTDGFKAFTAETARTNHLIAEQPALPLVTLEDSFEDHYSFDLFSGKYLLMTFIYTACTTVCPELERNAAQIYEQIPDEYLGEDIVFLSISFDTERDIPEVLGRYGEMFGIEGDSWRIARVPDDEQLDFLLDELGVIAIPDGQGDYQHNVAFYLIDRDGYLMDVMDYQDITGATDRVMSILQAGKEG